MITSYTASKSQSRYNDFYEEKKKRQKMFKHQLKRSNTDKYFPPHLRPTNEQNNDNEAKIKTYSIALKSPNAATTFHKNEEEKKLKIQHAAMTKPDNVRSPTYHDIQALALKEATNLHTSSERELALKRIVGAAATTNHLVLHSPGTLPIYQTDDFSFEQRTQCMVITGVTVVSSFVFCIAILAFMGYGG